MKSIWELDMKGNVLGAVAKLQSTVQRAFDQMGLNEQKLQGAMANTQRSVERTTGLFTGLRNTVMASFSLFSVVALGKQIVTVGSQMEQTRTAYNVLIGDIQKSNSVLGQLKNLADVTPFTNTEIFDAGKMLLGAQLPANQLANTLRQIGDISMGNSDVFNRMVQNYSQIVANQRANTMDIKQFAFAGVPIWSELSKVIGKSGDALRAYVEKGVSVKVIDQVLKNLTSSGGQFFGMMQKQSETFAGRWSTFVGNLQTVAINIFNAVQPFLNAVLKLAMDLLPKLTAFFEKLWGKAGPSLTRIGESLGKIVSSVLQIVSKMGPAFEDILNTVLPVMATALELVASALSKLFTYIANHKWTIQALSFAMKGYSNGRVWYCVCNRFSH